MSRSLNKVMLIGNVGGDPDVRTTRSGTRYAKLSLATNRRWKNRQDGSEQEKTEWHRLTFWGRTAEIVEQYVSKGARLYIEGRIEYSESESRDGQTRYWTDVIVEDMLMLGSDGAGRGGGFQRSDSRGGGDGFQRPSGGAGGGEGGGGRPAEPTGGDDDDLPF
ncbi:MAG: single-stranded DNA-binding protein [Gemmatimonadetes bacterium]|nr:single-stranded DNA-binding protein [Gemmatimonadota bacterium]